MFFFVEFKKMKLSVEWYLQKQEQLLHTQNLNLKYMFLQKKKVVDTHHSSLDTVHSSMYEQRM